ncbi:Glycoside hydrolase family 3 protein [Mycena chlorophos]|uniref:xylan 1,4-beta-xylosidase n=1 Tax=Mycena chlorophos TaxID=658473 RepID=A0A8H6WB69_MYCCL|nr:Glycoside hydrolase family 3 protein [Mycena chlorophos]
MSTEKTLRVAICGGGISGLCLAVALSQHEHIKVDVWESAERFKELGAGLMVFARTWRIFQLLGLEANFSAATHTKPDPSVGYQFRRSDLGEEGLGWHFVPFPFALSKYPHIQVDVYEAAGRFKEIGAGVMIWHRTWHILELLGLDAQFVKVTDSDPVPDMGIGFEYRRSDRKDAFSWYFVEMPYGCIRFHRAHFLDVFVDNLPSGVAHFGKRLVSYAERHAEGGIELTFADGATTSCDLLVGCDGIKSTVRKQMLSGRPELEAHVEPRWSGSIAYRGLIPVVDLPGGKHRAMDHPLMYCGKNKHVVVYSISRGTVANVVAFASDMGKENAVYGTEWVTECPKEEMLECFAGWEDEVSVLLNVLGSATPRTLDSALAAYEKTRLAMANHVVRESYRAGKMFEFNDEEFGGRYEELGPGIAARWDYLRESTPEGEWKKAQNLLRESAMSGLVSFVAAFSAALNVAVSASSIPAAPNVTISGSKTPASLTPYAFDFPDCNNGPMADHAVCDRSQEPIARAQALIDLFTTSELIANSVHQSPGVPRLGIPPYNWWSEASHGVSWTGPGVVFAPAGENFSYATSFPQPINLGAAFDDPLILQVSTETSGEAALHSAHYAYQFLDGFQGGIEPEPYLKNIATCKHYVAYDLDDWGGVIQRNFSADVTTQEMAEFYQVPFKTCVRDAKVYGVMCSYNSVNGVPACADDYTMQTIIRDHYGFPNDRWIVSDCDAVESIYDTHFYVDSYEAAAAVALKAGTDINCGTTYSDYLGAAFNESLATPTQLKQALVRQYASLIRLGYFDPPEIQPYRQYTWDDVSTPAAEQLAYQVAVEGMVLLKNDGTLPLKQGLKKMALIGPWAQATDQMQGNYYGTPPYLISPQMGFTTAGFDVNFQQGTSIQDGDTDGFAAAIAAAKEADVIVYAGGIDNSVEAEGLDRVNITWPGAQLPLIQQLAAVGKPFIVLQFGAGQVDDTWLLENDAVNAIVWGGYPGQSGGTAIADTLTGKVAPAGRLPLMQYPANYTEQIGMLDMNLRPNKATGNPGRTYQWYTGTPVVDYGFGLHYTTWSLSWQTTPASAYSIQTLVSRARSAAYLDLGAFDTFGVTVKNTGHVTSDFVAMLFVKTNAGPPPYPNKVLLGYSRVSSVRAGTAAIARISVNLGEIARVDENGNAWLYPGQYSLSLDVPEHLTHSFTLIGAPAQLTNWPAPPPAQSSSS